MCTDESSYSTICGPRGCVEHLIEMWTRLTTAQRFDLVDHGPTLIDLGRLESPVAYRFRDSTSPAVAVLEHPVGLGFSLTAQLQAELMVGNDYHHVSALPELLCEPGYTFHAAQESLGGMPQIFPDRLGDLFRFVPAVPDVARAAGPRVALLDTGLSAPGRDMIDFTDTVRSGVRGPMAADDGHGPMPLS